MRMSDDSLSANPGRRPMGLILGGHLLLVLSFGLDFHLDVRERDVFSWMDPYQYYEFALGVLAGSEHFTGFEVPSIFPFFLMPALAITPSIPAALWTNLAFTLLLVASVHGLCRELESRTPSPIVALLILSSPLLIGLSRTMYVEYALSGVVALAFLLWLRFLRSGSGLHSGHGRWGAGFAVVTGLGFMLKMTFPLFLILPVGAALVERLATRRAREARALVSVTLIPVAIALLVQAVFFPRGFAYYLSLGNTAVPIMNLIGPPEWSSWSSATFYLREVGRTLMFLLTPLLAVAALASWPRRLPASWIDLSGPRATLWLWLLGPLLLLIVQPVKEPRHVAPCVVPALLLGVLAIEGLPSRAVRRVLLALAVSLAIVQYAVVTTGRVETPYFLDRALHWEEIRNRMIQSEEVARYVGTPPASRLAHWKYNQNIVSVGFPANEALALAWQAFPGVVFDLETFEEPERLSASIPNARFEDLYILTALNSYNRRCGWRWYYSTLARETAVANADFVILNEVGADQAAGHFPDHVLVGSIPRDSGFIRILRSRRSPTTHYRALYAQAFLQRNPALPDEERRVVANELLTSAVLGGYDEKARILLRQYPFLAEPDFTPRNIHWIRGYDTIARLARERMPESPAQ
jgi:hypothetical protein